MRALKGLSEISEEFDGFILDLWGLIHDGVTAYPGVVDTFKALIKNETKTILLSNAPRRSRLLIDGMTAMGIAMAGVLAALVRWIAAAAPSRNSSNRIGVQRFHARI